MFVGNSRNLNLCIAYPEKNREVWNIHAGVLHDQRNRSILQKRKQLLITPLSRRNKTFEWENVLVYVLFWTSGHFANGIRIEGGVPRCNKRLFYSKGLPLVEEVSCRTGVLLFRGKPADIVHRTQFFNSYVVYAGVSCHVIRWCLF